MVPGPIVDAAWLRSHRDDVVVADVRWYIDGRSGRAAYDGGHIPGAVFVDLDNDLSDPPSSAGGRHPLPSPERFAEAMGRLGVGDGTAVVAYDDAGGAQAGRLWWMLDAIGESAAVLDGGIQAWGDDLETAPAQSSAATRTARPWPPDRFADADAVDRLRHDPAVRLIDARAAERYRGEPNPIDTRLGHIPGAESVPFTTNLDPATGRFRSPDALRASYGELPTVAYCGSGVTACHDLLARAVAGLPPGRLFVGSWSAWSADPDRPAATGD